MCRKKKKKDYENRVSPKIFCTIDTRQIDINLQKNPIEIIRCEKILSLFLICMILYILRMKSNMIRYQSMNPLVKK